MGQMSANLAPAAIAPESDVSLFDGSLEDGGGWLGSADDSALTDTTALASDAVNGTEGLDELVSDTVSAAKEDPFGETPENPVQQARPDHSQQAKDQRPCQRRKRR